MCRSASLARRTNSESVPHPRQRLRAICQRGQPGFLDGMILNTSGNGVGSGRLSDRGTAGIENTLIPPYRSLGYLMAGPMTILRRACGPILLFTAVAAAVGSVWLRPS